MKTPAVGRDETQAATAPISAAIPKTEEISGKEHVEATPPAYEAELRQRKPVAVVASQVKDTAKQAALALQHSQPEGVPVNIVFILCLLSFLIGYLFF